MTCSSTTSSTPAPPAISSLDRAGVIVSTACLLHCLLLPLVIAALPALTHLEDSEEWTHLAFASLAIPFAAFAMLRGYRRHGSRLPMSLAFPGVALLWVSLLVHDPHWLESVVTSVGAVMLGAGHLLNHRLACRCQEAR